jgi:SPP1 gp7 family putative phage head morphogenesis protein
MRYRAFTVSRLADGDAVQQVQKMLADGLEQGNGLRQFLQMTEGQLADAAGMGRGAGWYYETVYRTNTATAYNVGRAIAFEEVPPIALELTGIDDARQTEACHSLTVPPFRRPYGDPVWDSLWPPFHFNCRTTVRGIYDESEIDEAGGPDKFYSKGAPEYTPAEGFGAYPVGKADSWWDLTGAMRERAGEYGLEAEFLEAKEKLIGQGDPPPREDLSKKIKEVTGMDSVSLSEIPNDVQEGIKDAFESVINKFPQLKNKFLSLDDNLNIKDVYASCLAETGEISINRQFFSRLEDIISAYADDLENGFHPAGTDWKAVIVHETGHRVNTILDQMFASELIKWGDGYTMDVRIFEESMDKFGLLGFQAKYQNTVTELSEYAAKNSREFFAEAFAEYLTSKNPRRLALEAGRMIELALSGVFP